VSLPLDGIRVLREAGDPEAAVTDLLTGRAAVQNFAGACDHGQEEDHR
jgi:hypothetical protein